MNNALTGSAHTVDPDSIAAVPLEEDVNVHIAVVQTTHDTENAALCGDYRRASFVFRQSGCQLFGGYIIHKQPQRFGRLKFGKLRSLGANFLLGGFTLGSPFHQAAFFLFQLVLNHPAFHDLGVATGIFLLLVFFHRSDHHGQYRGFPLRRFHDDNHIGVERFRPVRIALDKVLPLTAQGHDAQRLHRRHVHGSLRGFRHRQHIAPDNLWQGVHGKCGKVVFVKGNRRVPGNRHFTVIGIRRDVPNLLADLGIEPLFPRPDALQFLLVQRRGALLGGLQEQVLCLRRIAVPLDDFGTDLRHGAVAAAFGNGVPKVCKSLLIFPVIQKRIQRDRTGMVDDLRIFRAKQKPCGIRGIGIEEREHCQQALFQRRIAVYILLRVNPENDMESWAGSFSSFWFLMVAAEVQHIGNIGKELRNVLRGDPIGRYI